MQEIRADLHIHSRFSRATSTKLNTPLLAAWAQVKGLAVIGTGDFTHPKWRDELRETLRYDEASGLYRLAAPELATAALPELPLAGLGRLCGKGTADPRRIEDATGCAVPPVQFMLQGEISSIYKRGGQVRKVHNLVFMPTIEAAERFSVRLGEIGNLHSDGRPILGLDSRDLLEMVLEADPLAFLVPAHIWTPWFSVFGSKSGFDHMEDCFGDLTSEIFALETGLSSDPSMIRLWSELDNYRLISNSDAHSGENLGREANVFAGEVSYQGILRALKTPEKAENTIFRGTVEFFPEEGKYHMDGHRKCNVVLSPEETRKLNGICPVCGSPLTVGVLYRVMELADREQPKYQDETVFASLVPLPEVLGEILGVGPKSRKVGDMYAKVLERFGPELTILQHTPEQDLARFFPPLGEAIGRMRRGEVQLHGGYDGEYGVVRMFTDKERQDIVRGTGGTIRKRATGVQGLSLLGDNIVVEGGTDAPIVRKKRGAKATEPETDSEADPSPGQNFLAAPSFSLVASGEGGEDDEDFVFSEIDDLAPPSDTGAETVLKSPRLDMEEHDAPTGLPQETPLHADAVVEGVCGSQPEYEEDPIPLHGLNPSQEHAVLAGPGPVLVLAGPGTGKTRTLIARIMHLLDEGIGARRILAVTFTRRAASEMDSRLSAALGQSVPLPRTDTLHALALELWHRTHSDVPVLLSEESARRVFAEANSEESAQTIREAWQAINVARERLEMPAPEYVEMGQRYFTQKAGWNLADYTDLLEFWLEQITGNLYTSQWGHILVDEVQDLSPLQLAVVSALVSSSGEGFFGIGDPDQSIYAFRGAHGQSREFFTAAWPGLEVISLTHNYRSRAGILAASHAVLGEAAACPALVPTREKPCLLALFEAPSADSEARWVAERIAALVGTGSHTLLDNQSMLGPGQNNPIPELAGTCSPGDIAVLVRTHALARTFRKALERTNVPVAEPATDAFWADERVALIIRAAGRMLGIAVAEAEEENRAPVCPDKVLAKGPLGVAAYFSTIPPFDALFWQSSAFRSLAKAFDTNGGWAELITWINLQNELELVRSKGEKVQILSMHAAKGLEFSVVFMPCLEDGLIPFAGPELLTGKLMEKKQAASTEEERRLFYVGLTRAKDALFLSYSSKRSLYGRELRLKPSRFLDALPQSLLTRSTLVAKATRKEKQLSLL